MIDDKVTSRFECIAAELRTLGLTLHRLPGEYIVNLRNGSDRTARMVETLDEALEVGRQMAAETTTSSPAKGQWHRWPRRRKSKASPRFQNGYARGPSKPV